MYSTHDSSPYRQAPPPVTQQPVARLNIPLRRPQQYCPPGLEFLNAMNHIFARQKVEALALTGYVTNKKFTIKNCFNQIVYYAVEDTNCCTRNFCGPIHPFDMRVLDNYGNEVIHIYRALRCDTCWCPCCLQYMEVSAPPGILVGTIHQEWTVCCPRFSVKDATGEIVLRIDGPFCTIPICGYLEFQIKTADGELQIGRIARHWSGVMREVLTDTNSFGISFPMDLAVEMKAVMMGACFLINAMFLDKNRCSNRQDEQMRRRMHRSESR